MLNRLFLLVLLASMTIILGCPGWPCESGFYDCGGNCIIEDVITSAVGNGMCDEAFNCSAFDYDGGDCEAPTTTTTTGGGDINLTMVSIPGGTFEMGCSPGDSDCEEDESPRHMVTISAFQMSAFETTQGQWEEVMGSNPSRFPECGPECPVEVVSWNDVQNFIERLNNQTGMQYRLPTEAEWEYAARAGATTKWHCGDDESCLGVYEWYNENSGDQTHPVGQKEPNAWGLYDMSGNVWEWCSDWYGSNYYESSPDTDPQGPDAGSFRVVRLGGWRNNAMHCRTSQRSSGNPLGAMDNRLGFRLCLSQ